MDQLSNGIGCINHRQARADSVKYKDILNIKTPSLEQKAGNLSGGNQQKIVLAKWLGNNSDIFILDCPTRGIDIGVKETIYRIMEDLKRDGKSIIMISEELPEVIGMSDRILVLKDGQIVMDISGEERNQMTVEKLIEKFSIDNDRMLL